MFFIIVALSFVFTSLTPAAAQYEPVDRDTFAVKAGALRPSDSDLRDVGKLWIGPEIDWYRSYDGQDRPTGYLSAGFFKEAKGAISARIAPIGYTWIRHFSDTPRGWFAGGGLSLNFMKIENFFTGSDSAIKAGIYITGGYNLSEHYFLEYRHSWVPNWRGVGWSGSTLFIGARSSL